MREALINICYLAAAALFILGFKGLARPKTAVAGNLAAAVGMLLAVAATLLDLRIVNFTMIAAGLVLGAAAGVWLAWKVPLTAMPQMVGLLNGFGGGASALVACAELVDTLARHETPGPAAALAAALSGWIGSMTFWGSLVAADKLEEWLLPSGPVIFRGQQAANALLAACCVLLTMGVALAPESLGLYLALLAAASLLGVLFVLPIGGADMPVVICLLNSYSGLAACATGFVLNNTALIIAGALVGASGVILTRIMCQAMNRSLANVLFGGLGGAPAGPADAGYGGKIKSATAEEVALILETARRVVVVPGYGMAVSQAQHAVRDLAELLESRGCEVEFAIHPVAGRMPGHMNVLLAEAEIPYEKLREMDEANPTFPQTDVAIVLGANDVVNPLARTDPSGPIGGMPILDVDKARTVVVVKRSLSPGFAGIPNPLFAADNTLMVFADAKQAVLEIVTALKSL